MMYLRAETVQLLQQEDLCKLHGLQVTDKLCLLDIGLYEGYDVKSLISYE